MSPLRPHGTPTSRPSLASSGAISPLGVVICALATLVAVPVLISSGASSDSVEVAAVAVDDTSSAADLDDELELDELFTPGARVDEVIEAPPPSSDPAGAADAVAQAVGGSFAVGVPANSAVADPQRAVNDQAARDDVPAEPVAESPQQSPPATAPPATAPPTTEPPTTQPAPTEPPPTEPPTTAAPTTTEPPVAEAAQNPEPAPAEPPAPNQPTAEQWAALRQCESSGSYTVVSRNGLYHGAYQFYQPTWDGLARQVGRTDLVGLPPSQAAPADQDALALLLWQQRGNQPWPHCGRYLPAGP